MNNPKLFNLGLMNNFSMVMSTSLEWRISKVLELSNHGYDQSDIQNIAHRPAYLAYHIPIFQTS
jgi:hypothetical protein